MLVKITQHCMRGCSHCLEGSTPAGTHMTEETFLQALDFTGRVELLAWMAGCPRTLLLSGGECTDHPDFLRFLQITFDRGFIPFVLTHGMWLSDPEKRAAILRPEWKDLFVQVTYDPRFYPPPGPPHVEDPRITYIPALSNLLPLGRAGRRPDLHQLGVPWKKAPSSFNLRSATRHLGSIEKAILMLRQRTMTGQSGHCIPTVNNTGEVMAGESQNCFVIGTVRSTNAELTQALVDMKCDRCGLTKNLTHEQKQAIGAA